MYACMMTQADDNLTADAFGKEWKRSVG